MRLRLFLPIALTAAALFWAGCGGDRQHPLNVVGSTSIQPFAEMLAQDYQKGHPGKFVDVQGGGSTAGLEAAANGLAEIGMCSRSLSDKEAPSCRSFIIARDGLAIVVHPSNPIDTLATWQLRGLFSGRIANWKEVGGRDMPVRMITREEGSGTRESFQKLVMEKDKISPKALTQESNGAVRELVRNDPAAVGYMSLGLVGPELKAVCIDGVRPTAADVLDGTYTLVRPFLFVTNGEPTPDAVGFIDYVLSADGQRSLETEGLIRAK